MRPLTHSAPRLLGAALGIVTFLTLAAPARAQEHDSALRLAAPRFGSDVATLRVARAASRPTPDVRPAGGSDASAVRIAAEVGVEVLTLGAAIAVPASIAGLSAHNCSGELFCITPDAFALAFGTFGAVLGEALLPPLLDAVASGLGGRGNVGAAYVGLLIGDALGAAALAGGLALGSPDALAALLVLGGVAVLAGPIVGYELSSANASHGAPSVVPTLAVARDGAVVVGVSGRL